jgi:hypothetical protein
MGLGIRPRGRGESKGKFKSRLKATAQHLFPRRQLNLENCDALLIAEYCRRVNDKSLERPRLENTSIYSNNPFRTFE